MLPPFTNDGIERIARGLLDHSLPKPDWTHPAHFAAAVWLLAREGAAAHARMPGIIRSYNAATGVPNTDTGGYHATITQASLLAAQNVLVTHPGQDTAAICAALLASELGDKDWLLAYWSRDRLFSIAARRAWLEPDIAKLPAAWRASDDLDIRSL